MMLLIFHAVLMTTPLSPAQEAQAMDVGGLLRCPVCQGMPIAESPAPMARAMMKQIRVMVAEGKNRDTMLTYFTDRYGDWVLLEPRRSGVAGWVWVLPPVGLVLALLVFLARMRATPAVPTPVSQRPTADNSPYLDAVRKAAQE